MKTYGNLQVGDRAIFLDDRQQEYICTVLNREDKGDHVKYVVESDSGIKLNATVEIIDSERSN